MTQEYLDKEAVDFVEWVAGLNPDFLMGSWFSSDSGKTIAVSTEELLNMFRKETGRPYKEP